MGALEGKTALVTGAGQGVGRCHAEFLAAEGASVVVNDISDSADDVVDAITSAGGAAVAFKGSVSDWDAAGQMIATAVDTFGDLDILINNAGFVRDAMSFSMTEEQWNSVVDVHLKGHFVPTHHAAARWRASAKATENPADLRPRRIINTTSESGLFGGPAQANYGSAKGGIITLTLIMAKELGRYGITANCIAPRARTQMNEMMERFAAPETGFDPYDPGHVSPMVGWLASDEACDVNGQTFIVTGDEIHRMAQPTVEAAIFSGDARWTIDAITARRSELLGEGPCQLPMWGGPAMR